MQRPIVPFYEGNYNYPIPSVNWTQGASNVSPVKDVIDVGSKSAGGLKGMFNNIKGGKGAFGTPWKTAGISGAVSGVQALMNGSELTKQRQTNDAIEGDILRSYSSNPIASSMLTSDQQAMVNQIKRGNYDGTEGGGFEGIMSNMGDTLMSTGAGALFGGVPGAIAGGLGSLLNSGIKGDTAAEAAEERKLEALFQALQGSEMQYNSMKQIPVRGLGLRPSAVQAMNY